MRKRVFISPGRYVQGAGIMETIGQESSKFGKMALVLADETVWGITGSTVQESFDDAEADFIYEEFTGEASNSEIQRLAELAKDQGADVIIGLGGGKTIDTAKAVADEIESPIIVAPTTASTDAPTSALSVIYSDEGVFEDYKFYDKNPDLVMLDSQVIVGAPVHLLASGMGDALATLVEAKAAIKRNADTMAGGKATLAGQAIAEMTEKVIFQQGIAAFEAAKKGVVTPHLENIIEANTLLSGLGFENAGLAAAHAIHNGFTAVEGEIHDLTHGQKVAYGILTQLVLEGYPEEEILRYADFFKAIELPTTLAEMHLDHTPYEELVEIGKLATADGETAENMDPELTAEEIADALIAVDSITNRK